LLAAKPLPQRALGVSSILAQSPSVRRSHAIRVWRRRCRIKIEQPPTLTRPHERGAGIVRACRSIFPCH
jgi:hypothetical protein